MNAVVKSNMHLCHSFMLLPVDFFSETGSYSYTEIRLGAGSSHPMRNTHPSK